MFPGFDFNIMAHVSNELNPEDFEKIFKVKSEKLYPAEIQIKVTFGIKDNVLYLLDEEIPPLKKINHGRKFKGVCKN